MSSNNFGFLPNTTSYGEKFAKLEELKVLYAKVAKSQYLCDIYPSSVKCFFSIADRDLIPYSTCND